MATDDDYSRGTATMVKASARVRAPGVADASRRVNRREPPCQPPRGKPSAQRRTTTTTHHRAPVPPRSTPWRPARPLHRAERHGAQRQRKTQPPPTPTATTNRPPTATHEQTTRANLGLLYSNLGEYDKAKENYNRALASIRSLGYIRDEAALLANLGHLHLLHGDHSQAHKTLIPFPVLTLTFDLKVHKSGCT